MKNLYLSIILLTSGLLAFGQSANEECATALELTQLNNWCSGSGAFNTIGATGSTQDRPSCFPASDNDVWFSFVATATDLNVSVSGATSPVVGGTMISPEFALYSGDCDGVLTEIQCASDAFGSNVAETFAGPLAVGNRYYIRVDARNGNEGTFQICINNFNQVPAPDSDCPTGVILCDKSPFTVEQINGIGLLDNEVDGSCMSVEHGSTWYKWTCDQAGPLTFTLTPTNPSDDLDFIVFELPNGIDDCSVKIEERCVSSGENVGEPFSEWEPCSGPTGLSETDNQTTEFPGCAPVDNNFAAPLFMEAGKSYAVLIDNFSNTGNGFSIEFGGTGTFLGPEATFTPSQETVCLGEPITFTDVSSSVGGIDNWEWVFGAGATPGAISGEGPHTVDYTTPGRKSIVLRITDASGCLVTVIQQIEVLDGPEVVVETTPDYCGAAFTSGDVFLTTNVSNGPYLIDWNDGRGFVPDTFLTNIASGSYTATVQNGLGCESSIDFTVDEGLDLTPFIEGFVPPTCFGDSDGSISVAIEVGSYPISYDFGDGIQADSFIQNIPAGNYTVDITDINGCSGSFDLVLDQFPPVDLTLDATNISCNGESDGQILSAASGGAGDFSYQWSTSSTDEEISSLFAGDYFITVTDINGCATIDTATINEPPPIILDTLAVGDVICFGDTTGQVSLNGQGGTPPIQYSSDGISFQVDPTLINLLQGDYLIIAEDSRGCRDSFPITIEGPEELIINAGPDTTINLGFTAGIRTVKSPFDRPVAYTWTPTTGLQNNTDPFIVATPPRTTTYTVEIIDENGCTASDLVTIFVNLERPIFAPNIFSPNGNGTNDNFTLFAGPAVRSIRNLKVFNRWGGLVFEGADLEPNNLSQGWDGTFRGEELNPDVFAYVAEVEFIDDAVVIFKGDVTLVK